VVSTLPFLLLSTPPPKKKIIIKEKETCYQDRASGDGNENMKILLEDEKTRF
jgi:hypothetical protein